MPPYFETVKSFAEVQVTDDGVCTHEFLEASNGVVDEDLLGIGVFSFVRADIESNILGVRTTYDADQDSRKTLEELVRSEAGDDVKHGTASLRRLTRGLLFTCRALQEARENPHEDKLQPAFSRAYDAVLRRHHGWAVRTVVQTALLACPKREHFFEKITDGGSREKLDEELEKWLAGLDAIVQRVVVFYRENGHGDI